MGLGDFSLIFSFFFSSLRYTSHILIYTLLEPVLLCLPRTSSNMSKKLVDRHSLNLLCEVKTILQYNTCSLNMPFVPYCSHTDSFVSCLVLPATVLFSLKPSFHRKWILKRWIKFVYVLDLCFQETFKSNWRCSRLSMKIMAMP
jgi:hypothetical protein